MQDCRYSAWVNERAARRTGCAVLGVSRRDHAHGFRPMRPACRRERRRPPRRDASASSREHRAGVRALGVDAERRDARRACRDRSAPARALLDRSTPVRPAQPEGRRGRIAGSAKTTSSKSAAQRARNPVLRDASRALRSAYSSDGDVASTSTRRKRSMSSMHFTSSTLSTSLHAEGDRARPLALRDAVVEEFEVQALVAARDPREEELRHPGVRLDAVRERVVDGLVAADLESAVPRALDQRCGRRDHEEEVDDVTEARQQVAAGLVGVAARSCRSGSGRSAGATCRRARPCAPCSGRASRR